MRYFNLSMNLHEIQRVFTEQSVILHPDTSKYDSDIDFIELKREYEFIKAFLNYKNDIDKHYLDLYEPHLINLNNKIKELEGNSSTNWSDLINKSIETIGDISTLAKQTNKSYKSIKKQMNAYGINA